MATAFFRNSAGTDSSLLRVWARKLHENLLAAGWTLEWANADAIGTGSAGSPNWDKAPAVNTSAGQAIYKMPKGTFATAWFVRIEPRWGGSALAPTLDVQVGTGQSGGVLASPSTTVAVSQTISSVNNTIAETFVVAHEEAFCICLHGGNSAGSFVLHVGRKRDLSGDVLDDITTAVMGGGGITVSGPAGINVSGSCVTRSAQNGDQAAARFVCFTSPGAGATSCVEPTTMNFPVSAEGFPLGPYLTSGGLGGPPRLWSIVATQDSVAGTDQLYVIDGLEREFVASASPNAIQWHGRNAFART